ncbi:class A beta-lactamase [Solidesulfovibrio fructosivorans]
MQLTGPWHAAAAGDASLTRQIASLEQRAHGHLGVALLNASGALAFTYRGQERFPFCSTFKFLVAAAVLQKSLADPALLDTRIRYGEGDLLSYAPVTRKNVARGMTVAELCAAALQVSDNTAANLLIRQLGGTRAVNAFARSLGDTAFRLDHLEPDLNAAIPGDPHDTSTPEAMARSMREIALGKVLGPAQRDRFVAWIKGNTTGDTSIRAGVPPGWTVGDKTGGGAYGTSNDVAVIWPPHGKPIVLAIYFTQQQKDAPARRDVLADAARLVVKHFLGE